MLRTSFAVSLFHPLARFEGAKILGEDLCTRSLAAESSECVVCCREPPAFSFSGLLVHLCRSVFSGSSQNHQPLSHPGSLCDFGFSVPNDASTVHQPDTRRGGFPAHPNQRLNVRNLWIFGFRLFSRLPFTL